MSPEPSNHLADGLHDSDDENYYTCDDNSSSNSYDLTVEPEAKGNDKVWTSVSVLEDKCVSLEEKVNDIRGCPPVPDQERLMQLLQQLETKVAMFQSPPMESIGQYQNVNYWIHGYKLMVEHMKKCNWRLCLKTMAETATQFPDAVSPVILKFEGYESAKVSRMTMISAPFFTSGPGKYKLQLIVHVNT